MGNGRPATICLLWRLTLFSFTELKKGLKLLPLSMSGPADLQHSDLFDSFTFTVRPPSNFGTAALTAERFSVVGVLSTRHMHHQLHHFSTLYTADCMWAVLTLPSHAAHMMVGRSEGK